MPKPRDRRRGGNFTPINLHEALQDKSDEKHVEHVAPK